MQAFLQAIGVAVLALDRGADGRIRLIGANDHACRLLGLNLAAVFGQPVARCLPRSLAAEVERAVAQCLDGGLEDMVSEHCMALPEGRRRLRISHRSVAGGAGDGRCVISTVTAVEQETPEAGTATGDPACGNACQHLHRMEVLGRLASGCGHALNNHLQPILTFSRHMREDTPPETRQQYLNFIYEAALQIRDVMETAQAIARTGREADGVPVVVPVAGLLRDVARAACLILPPQVAVRVETDPPEGRIMACRAELAQALLALVLEAAEDISGKGEVLLGAGRAGGRHAGVLEIAIATAQSSAPDEPEQAMRILRMPEPARHAVIRTMLVRWGGRLSVTSCAPGTARIRISLPEAAERPVPAF